jgi:hypothetical protein
MEIARAGFSKVCMAFLRRRRGLIGKVEVERRRGRDKERGRASWAP